MTELAYMIRGDWAQEGTAMVAQSAVIRDWLGDGPYAFAVADAKKLAAERPADLEYMGSLEPDASQRRVFSFAALSELTKPGETLDHAVTLVHPYKDADCELLREIIETGRIARIFVIIWSRRESIRVLLDGFGAVDLHTGERARSVDPLMLEAARCMVDEQYNGLGSGRGKDAVIQLLRVFTETGYPLDEEAWLRAFYAAGGKHDEALKIGAFIREMHQGVKHRAKQRYVPEILDVLRARVMEASAVS